MTFIMVQQQQQHEPGIIVILGCGSSRLWCGLARLGLAGMGRCSFASEPSRAKPRRTKKTPPLALLGSQFKIECSLARLEVFSLGVRPELTKQKLEADTI